jgi:hypothetical protein
MRVEFAAASLLILRRPAQPAVSKDAARVAEARASLAAMVRDGAGIARLLTMRIEGVAAL